MAFRLFPCVPMRVPMAVRLRLPSLLLLPFLRLFVLLFLLLFVFVSALADTAAKHSEHMTAAPSGMGAVDGRKVGARDMKRQKEFAIYFLLLLSFIFVLFFSIWSFSSVVSLYSCSRVNGRSEASGRVVLDNASRERERER